LEEPWCFFQTRFSLKSGLGVFLNHWR
jgi:hypothetical protein